MISVRFDTIAFVGHSYSNKSAYGGMGLASFHNHLLTSYSNIFGCSSFLTLRGSAFQLFMVL